MTHNFGFPRETSIISCGFSVRVYNTLEKMGILTIGDLEQLSLRDMTTFRNFGTKCMKEVFNWMAEHVQVAYDAPLKKEGE